MADEQIRLTKAGLAKLEEEYRRLIDIERPRVIEDLQLARSQGDLSENADYDAARNKQAEIEGRITEIEHIKDVAVIVEDTAETDGIGLGSVFTYVEVEGDKEVSEPYTVKLVGSVESNPFAELPLVSIDSPLAKAAQNALVGNVVRVDVDAPYHILIKSIENAEKAQKKTTKKK